MTQTGNGRASSIKDGNAKILFRTERDRGRLYQQRRQTFAALLDQLEGLAKQQPVLVVCEDMHWADATTLELFDLTVDRIRGLPILVLMTFRPEFEPPWAGLINVSLLRLDRLDRQDTRALVEQVTVGRQLPGEMMTQIINKTDGIPLFVEELTKMVLESGLLVEAAGRYCLNSPLPPLAIPATLRDSLMARLDRLAPVKEVAQIGAAIGRDFSYTLLRCVAGRDDLTLSAALGQLEEAELLLRRGTPPSARPPSAIADSPPCRRVPGPVRKTMVYRCARDPRRISGILARSDVCGSGPDATACPS